MKAETAYNVIMALPEEEKHRLYRMLEVTPKVIPLKPLTQVSLHWSPQEATDYLMRLFSGQSERRAVVDKKQNPERKVRVYKSV